MGRRLLEPTNSSWFETTLQFCVVITPNLTILGKPLTAKAGGEYEDTWNVGILFSPISYLSEDNSLLYPSNAEAAGPVVLGATKQLLKVYEN
jgi:hypothetical protein